MGKIRDAADKLVGNKDTTIDILFDQRAKEKREKKAKKAKEKLTKQKEKALKQKIKDAKYKAKVQRKK